jgi:hypothetical protein
MQRVVSRPSVAWLLLVGLLVSSGILTATRGLGAFSKSAACTGYGYGYASGYGYGSPAPGLTLALNHVSHQANTAVRAAGVLSQNGCVLPNEIVRIQRRVVVLGTPAGAWVNIATVATDGNGAYASPVYSTYDSAFRAFVLPKAGRPGVFSPTRLLNTTIGVSAYAPSGKATTIARICGRTIPYKGGQRVTLYRYNNALQVWKALQVTHIGAGSIYCFAVKLPKGLNTLSVNVPADTVNHRGLKRVYDFRT